MSAPAETSDRTTDPLVEEISIVCCDVSSALLATVIFPEADKSTFAFGVDIKFPVWPVKFKLPTTETSNVAGVATAPVGSLSTTVTLLSVTSPVAIKSKSRLSLAKLLS